MPSIDDLRSNDPKVHERAWNAAYPMLWNAAMQLLHGVLGGSKHTLDREDLAIKAITELEKKLPELNQIRTSDDLVFMVRRIVRLRTISFYRFRGRRPEALVAEIDDTDLFATEPESPYAHENFHALIATLPPPLPEVFRLHYEEDCTTQQIAEKLRLPKGTITSHLARGREKLERDRKSVV